MDCKLTIFTPTYNRGYLIEQLYKSLVAQSVKDFEWIVIDDDSSDDTEQIVKSMLEESNGFLIRYYKQSHGGKHRAVNKGVELAKGNYFFIVDSDDTLTEDAVEKIYTWISEVDDMDNIAGVAGLRMDTNKKIIGSEIKCSEINGWVEASNLERRKKSLLGDKAEIYKTDILRKYPFPEFMDEYFVTEAVVWDIIAYNGYKLRWYNIPIYVCEYLPDGLTQNGANETIGNVKNYYGYSYYVEQCIKIKPAVEHIVNFRQFNKVAKLKGKKIFERAKDIGMSNGKYIFYLLVELPILYAFRKLTRY